MAGPWQTYPQNFGMYPNYYTSAQATQHFSPTAGYYGNTIPYQQPLLDGLHPGLHDYDELHRSVLPAQGSNRTRRRVNAGGEHVKFRRTRSGCYTCRNRRVKCDETRPVCERCRKGNRECVYPEPATSTKARRDSNKSQSLREGDDEGSSQEDDEFMLEDDDAFISGFDEPESATSTDGPTLGSRASTDQPSQPLGGSPSSSADAASPVPRTQRGTPALPNGHASSRPRVLDERKMHELPEDIRYYLQYATTKMSHHHWGVRIDHQNFFRRTMIELALRYDPLLYALVGFAAYHCTIEKPDGKLGDFLGYYQKSITLLRQTFRKQPTVATILTVLQLATIEEYLGDWVNLMNHQKAALALITTLYTPEQMCTHESYRKVLQWYARFDIFVGILSGSAIQLGREWFQSQVEFYKKQCTENKGELAWIYEERYAWTRLTGYDLRAFMRRRAAGEMSDDEFEEQLDIYDNLVETIYSSINPLIMEDSTRVEDISEGRTKSPDDIVDPFEPKVLFGGALYETNMVIHDMIGFELLYRNLVGVATGKFDNDAIRKTCLRQCQLYEAATMYSGSPPGVRFSMQAGLALSILFLRANEKEIWWARKAFAQIEANGYTYPIGLRTRLEALWDLDITHWWLPEDQPRLVKQIRDFVQSKPNDDTETNLYELKGIFKALQLSGGDSPERSQPTSPKGSELPTLARRQSARSVTAMSAHSDDQFDFDVMAEHDRANALGLTADLEWT